MQVYFVAYHNSISNFDVTVHMKGKIPSQSKAKNKHCFAVSCLLNLPNNF